MRSLCLVCLLVGALAIQADGKILIGGTGFLGKVTLSMLLYRFPNIGQVYVTATKPGVVKAWYRHHRQIDQIALAQGTLQLVLYDTRDDSPTRGLVQTILIADRRGRICSLPDSRASLSPGAWSSRRPISSTRTRCR